MASKNGPSVGLGAPGKAEVFRPAIKRRVGGKTMPLTVDSWAVAEGADERLEEAA